MDVRERRLTDIVSVRFTEREVAALREAADEATLSSFVRELCLEALARRSTTRTMASQTYSVGSNDPLSLRTNSSAWTGPSRPVMISPHMEEPSGQV